MRKGDQALKVIHVRVISAVYFGLFALVASILINVVLSALELSQQTTVVHFVGSAVLIAAVFGFMFGEGIMHCTQPTNLKAFALGFVMVLLALPCFDLLLIALLRYDAPQLFATMTLLHFITLFFITWAYSFIYVGIWLAIIAGFAAMFLRSQLVYDLLRSQLQRQKFYKAHHLKDGEPTAHPVKTRKKT